MPRAHYIGLGSNLGNRHRFLDDALQKMEVRWGVQAEVSSRYATPPWGMEQGHSDFINQVACYYLQKAPLEVIQDLLEIEHALGRVRDPLSSGYQSRTIDLDILVVEGVTLDDPQLTLPHPRIELRRFVLEPLFELAPALRLRPDGPTVEELLRTCPDHSPLEKLNPVR